MAGGCLKPIQRRRILYQIKRMIYRIKSWEKYHCTGKEDYKLELITNIIGIIIGAGAEDLTSGILETITMLIELIEIYFTIER